MFRLSGSKTLGSLSHKMFMTLVLFMMMQKGHGPLEPVNLHMWAGKLHNFPALTPSPLAVIHAAVDMLSSCNCPKNTSILNSVTDPKNFNGGMHF